MKPINLNAIEKAIFVLRRAVGGLEQIETETKLDLEKTIKELNKEADRLQSDIEKSEKHK